MILDKRKFNDFQRKIFLFNDFTEIYENLFTIKLGVFIRV